MQGRRYRHYIAIIFLCLLSSFSNAQPSVGATLSIATVAKEPPNLHGAQLMLNYDPDCFHWRKFNVYFDGGYTHYWDNSLHNHVINIYSLAPVIRYVFKRRGYVLPFLELSIGIGYMDQTRFEHRNLGIHYTFQDRMGIGVLVGNKDQYLLGLHAVHYSNAHISSHNSGISVPIEIDLGYRFT